MAMTNRAFRKTKSVCLMIALLGSGSGIGGETEGNTEILANSATGAAAQCVEPTDVMRRYHMDFLLHQRDKTVHEGIRTKKHSLKGCIDCHVETDSDGQFIPINAEGQFCAECHQYASVRVDCFDCHGAVPDSNPGQAKLDTNPHVGGKMARILNDGDIGDHDRSRPWTHLQSDLQSSLAQSPVSDLTHLARSLTNAFQSAAMTTSFCKDVSLIPFLSGR